jgi:hypothetical protein
VTLQEAHGYRSVPSSGCQQAVDGLGWPTTDVVRLDHVALGVRTRDEPVRAALRALLADQLRHDRPDAPPNFSLHVAEAPDALSDPSAQGLCSVLRGCTTTHRARGVGELLRAFVACLEDDYRARDEPGGLVLDAVCLAHDNGDAALLPESARSLVYRHWAELADSGWRVAPTMAAQLDSSRRLVVGPARVRVRLQAVSDLQDLGVLQGVPHQAAEGSYQIRQVFAAGRMGADRVTSRANSFLELWARTPNRGRLGNRAAFQMITELLRDATIAAAPRQRTTLTRALASGS